MLISKLPMLRLKELVTLELSVVEDLYDAYATSKQEGSRIFATIVKRALIAYQRRRPQSYYDDVQVDMTNYQVHFIDNFNEYIAGNIGPEDIELIPLTIGYVKSGTSFISARYWEYRKPILYVSMGYPILNCRIFHEYKMDIRYADDGEFTEDSAIYFMDDSFDEFISLVSWVMFKVVRQTLNAISLGTIELFPQIDQLISDYQTLVQDSEESDLTYYQLWRK